MLVFDRLSIVLCHGVVLLLVVLLSVSGHPQIFSCTLVCEKREDYKYI